MKLTDRCQTKGKRINLAEISPFSSSTIKPNDTVSVDGDNLPYQLQETGLHVIVVPKFERGMAVKASRKKDKEIKQKAKEARFGA